MQFFEYHRGSDFIIGFVDFIWCNSMNTLGLLTLIDATKFYEFIGFVDFI